MRRTTKVIAAISSLTSLLTTSCNDTASERRIERRWEAVNATIAGMEKRERQSPRRIREAGETLTHWLEQESERFNERVKIIGDYAW